MRCLILLVFGAAVQPAVVLNRGFKRKVTKWDPNF